MTEFSLNTEFENLIKATLIADDMNQQQQQQNMMPNKEHDESAKSRDFFQNNNAIKKRSKACTKTRIKSTNFLSNMSVSIRKIFTMKILYLTFIHYWLKI